MLTKVFLFQTIAMVNRDKVKIKLVECFQGRDVVKRPCFLDITFPMFVGDSLPSPTPLASVFHGFIFWLGRGLVARHAGLGNKKREPKPPFLFDV